MVSGSLGRVAEYYTIYSGSSAEGVELIEFFRAAYAGEFNAAGYRDDKKIIDKWEWANLNNPNRNGFRSMAWICRENNSRRIVGHFGIMPVSLKYKGSYYPAVWGRDLIVLPQFRKLGIGPFLTSFVLKEARDEAAIFMIAGLNDNDQVYRMYNKFGFADMGHIPLYVRVNRLKPVIRSKINHKILTPLLSGVGNLAIKLYYGCIRAFGYSRSDNGGICIDEIASFDGSFDRLWEEASAPFDIIVRRDSAALNWRFVRQPYWDYKIFKASRKDRREPAGYIVLREGKSRGLRTGIISDIFASADDQEILRSMVRFAVSYFAKNDYIAIIRCDVLSKAIGSALVNSGFISIPSGTRFMFTNIRDGLYPAPFKDRNNWFIDYADSDLDLSGRPGA
ncbi:MAG: GNAT family N-acetyltransferase [Candidatus Omnitrophica bacterium]|nr:GNAT family N-acetyltransferase [Candidatus Omnitrophota bacterium]MBU1808955.1 GNAT family N-acetyltransferase [Candidatus Omnitrophota bacterium]